ncbi:MAG: molecular chaperone HtpG [Clostridia bacterium]|nr:molecular chaperone HtpG [Clostridia bacterium]MBR6752833.1 molecular chaperone HtpG [Clostridia bacterium]
MATKGNISIHAQNIMPVIKRWLYSDKDIFIRELVSNGCDAITKYKMIKGDTGEDFRVTVTVDKENRTLTFTDNGIGMTAEEVDKYINQVAFSSAEEFLKNYTGEDKGGIIGHFGLGFYSAFMAAEKVTIDTLSWQENAAPVLWQSEDGMEFTMEEGSRTQRGTTIVLHISEEEKEFCEAFRVREVLDRYCGFMATPIYLVDINKEEKHEDGCECEECHHDHEEKPVNDVNPLWLKNPRDCTEEEYKETYKKVFRTFEDPLFWVHLNVDYPFNLKGILYFPRIKKDFGGQEGQIKLFNRQVFVADNIKEVIPEFLMLLKGVLDCPDLPLNISRSFLQNDGYVKKLSAHITKKVADKLNGLFNTERKQYETYWDDIHPFVKYGCIRDNKFYDMVKSSILYKTTEGEYLTIDEYTARNEGKAEKKIYYTTEQNRQASAVSLYTKQGMDVVVMDTLIDMNFMSFMEFSGGMAETRFVRVDSDVSGLTEDTEDGKDLDAAQLEKLFKEALSDDTLKVQLEALSDHDLPLLLTEDEQMRRYKEMSVLYGQGMDFPAQYALVLNRLCPAVRSLAAMENEETAHLICRQMFDIARLSSRPLEAKDLQAFIARSNQLLSLLADKV